MGEENYEPVLDAFTHFTHENTNGLLIVVDLQREKRGDTFLIRSFTASQVTCSEKQTSS